MNRLRVSDAWEWLPFTESSLCGGYIGVDHIAAKRWGFTGIFIGKATMAINADNMLE